MASEIIKGKDGFIRLDGTIVKFTGSDRPDAEFRITAESYILIVLPKWRDGYITLMDKTPSMVERLAHVPQSHPTTRIISEGFPSDTLIEFLQSFWNAQLPLKPAKAIGRHPAGVSTTGTPTMSSEGKSIPDPHLIDYSDKYLSDYVVVDVETTGLSDRADKIIEIGAIRYIDDVEVARFNSLIRPYTTRLMTEHSIEEFRFLTGREDIAYIEDSKITELTGITNEMLSTAPSQWEVAPAFFDFVGNLPVVGHNIVKFDNKFIRRMASSTKIKTSFGHESYDTINMAAKLTMSTSMKLAEVGRWLGIEGYLGNHRAMDDASYTAKVFQEMKVSLDMDQLKTFRKLDNRLLSPGAMKPNPVKYSGHPAGSVFVFTGELKMRRSEAMQRVLDFGGQVSQGVTKKTNYLVFGEADGNLPASKIQRSREYIDTGQSLQVLSETDFTRLLTEWEGMLEDKKMRQPKQITLDRISI